MDKKEIVNDLYGITNTLRLQSHQLRNHGKHVVIVEGPAGAGKSHLLGKVAQLPNCDVVSRSLQKREFEVVEAARKSLLNDLDKLGQAILSTRPVVFIDRCIVSQRIYHALRTDSQPRFGNLYGHTTALLEAMEIDYADRMVRQPYPVNVHFLFLIPSLALLKHRREQSTKTYANSAYGEINLYKKAVQSLIISGRCLSPQYETEEDTNHIVNSLENWLKTYSNINVHGLWDSFVYTPRMRGCID